MAEENKTTNTENQNQNTNGLNFGKLKIKSIYILLTPENKNIMKAKELNELFSHVK